MNSIIKKMHELERIINYSFHNIDFLKDAMDATKIKPSDEYKNDAMAALGDAILKMLLTEILYKKGVRDKREITDAKTIYETNRSHHTLAKVENTGIIKYAYNQYGFYDEVGKENSVRSGKDHFPYIEAIVCAIYLDSNIDETRSWIINWLVPHINKMKK